jgi:RNA polymerase sigma-70 factor (ECF subfamily)
MEEARAIHRGVSSEPGSPSNIDDVIFLEQFIGEEAASLMGILRSYVLQYQLARGKEDVQDAALELLHEVYIRAVKSYARFDRSRPIRAWLLTIARNLALDKQAALGKRQQHESLMSDLRQQTQTSTKDEDPLERLFAASDTEPEQQIEIREQLTYLFSRLSEENQHVLRLWAVEGLDGTELAQQLGCSYKSAIVRLHRARKQLRTILATERGGKDE